GATPMADPLASLLAPTAPSTTFAAVNYSGSAPLTLSPGTYVGGIKLAGQSSVTLLPGLYYLKGGGFSVTGQASVIGNGVMIYNAPASASDGINFAGGGSISLTPQTSGTYIGMTLFQDRTSQAPINMSGDGGLNLVGSIYAAKAKLSITGGGGLSGQGDASH